MKEPFFFTSGGLEFSGRNHEIKEKHNKIAMWIQYDLQHVV